MDINKASREELEKAFQVDGQRAEYIVSKREEVGGFDSWEQFKKVVPGFEDKMVENLEAAGLSLGRKHSGETQQREQSTRSTHDSREGTHNERGRESHATRERETGHESGQQHSAESQRGKRDINEASAEELQRAFQVDGERAHYLVQKRREMGGFKSWDDIKEHVPSFEDKMIEHLEEAGFTLRRAA